MNKDHEERWNAINTILRHATPYGLQVECIDSFIQDIADLREHVDYAKAASDALYEWDI